MMLPPPPWAIIRPLDHSMDISSFTCGDAVVDTWFHENAMHAQDADQCRTHVCLDASGRIVAFYSTVFTQSSEEGMPSKTSARGFVNGYGVTFLVCWLGVAVDLQGRGYGKALMHEILFAAEAVHVINVFPIIALDALPGREPFYEDVGFRHAKSPEGRMFMRMSTVIRLNAEYRVRHPEFR